MAEYIERIAILGKLADRRAHTFPAKAMVHTDTVMQTAYKDIMSIPAADVVEVVRCKACRHWKKDTPGCTDFVGRCNLANYMVGATGFCVYGERMDGK